jgi:hypothetical protein
MYPLQQQHDDSNSSQTPPPHASTMTYNTLDEASLVSSSLHAIDHDDYDETYVDLNEGDNNVTTSIDSKRKAFSNCAQKDISMDLNDLLQEIEEERDESHSDSSVSSNSVNLSLNDGIENSDDSPQQKIGSNLQLDDFPSSRGLDWGSLNWGSFMGSFSDKMNGSSSRLLHRKDSVKKKMKPETEKQPEPRKKVVRFKKFETVF